MTPREEAEKIFGSLRGSLIGKPLDEAIIDLLAHTLQSRNEQLKVARAVIESLVNIEGIAWMNHRTTDVALRKAREWLEKNKETQ